MERFNKIFGLDLRKKCRETEYVTARYAVYHFLHERGWKQAVIARAMKVDRGMVYYGIRRFGELLEIGDELTERYHDMLLNAGIFTCVGLRHVEVPYKSPVSGSHLLCGDGIGEHGDNAAAATKQSDRG